MTEATLTPLYGERAIAEAELICFDNPRPGRAYEVSITLPEFTCKCPFSGYPDFATLRLTYQPGPAQNCRCVGGPATEPTTGRNIFGDCYMGLTVGESKCAHDEIVA